MKLLAYQRHLASEHNQLVYLEISECYVLDVGIRVPAALPDVVHSVSLLEQWIGEQSLPIKELNVHGRLIANSLLYKYAHTRSIYVCLYAHDVCTLVLMYGIHGIPIWLVDIVHCTMLVSGPKKDLGFRFLLLSMAHPFSWGSSIFHKL